MFKHIHTKRKSGFISYTSYVYVFSKILTQYMLTDHRDTVGFFRFPLIIVININISGGNKINRQPGKKVLLYNILRDIMIAESFTLKYKSLYGVKNLFIFYNT